MRLVASFCIAVVISLALFWLMRSLIWSDAAPTEALLIPTPLNVVEVRPEPPQPQTQQQLPAPPVPAALPTASTSVVPSVYLPAASLPTIELPGVGIPTQLSGKPQTGSALAGTVSAGNDPSAFAAGQGGFTGADLVPMASARPKYPRSAANARMEGWVELVFKIRGDGYVENVRVLDASPRGIFEDAAVYAMQRWVYVPYTENGRPVSREATQLFEFRAEDILPLYIWED